MRDRKSSGYRSLKFQQLESRCLLDASALRITEFMASNDSTLLDFEGDSSDWIEIYNPSTTVASLDGLYLTDKDDNLTKWQFPSGQLIDPGEFLVVFASDKDTLAPNGEIHTNFKLSAGGEYVGLIANNGLTVIDDYSPEYPQQFEDISYGLSMTTASQTLVAEGATANAWIPTSGVFDATWTSLGFNELNFNIQAPTGFGYENSSSANPDYSNEYSTAVPSGTSSLYVRIPFTLNSLDAINQLTLRMKYDDGFIAYLNGTEIASANAPPSPAWNSTATSIHNDFDAIVFQDFDVSQATSSLIQGENILAIHALNLAVGSSDFLVVPELVAEQTTIVSPEDLGYFEVATPGSANGEAFAGFVEEPTFSVPHGFYETAQQVSLSSATPGALIVYTTDGSTPTVDSNLNITNGLAYVGPITISSTTTVRATAFKMDYEPSFVQSASYLFLDDIVNQSPTGQAPNGWPNFDVNGQNLDYGLDPEIISLYGEQAVKDSLASIPSITLTTDLENLFDSNTGIYVNALNRGRQWERMTSVELIDSEGGGGFSTNAGLRIRGGFGRNDFNPKHAFRLYFRSEYGDGKLDYPLFGEEGVDEFDVLDLRTSSNYSWASNGGNPTGVENTYLREVFARDTQADMDQPYTRSRYYHLYLNGQYWGLYMTQERIQENYGETYFGGDDEDYDVVKSDTTEGFTTEIADGNDIAWQQLYLLAQDLADNPSSSADNYWAMQGLNPDGTRNENLEVLLDVDNLIDYMMIIIYTGGYDTGISAFLGNSRANNWFGIRNRETGDQGFQFFLHDNEHSLGSGELNGIVHGTQFIDRTGPFFDPTDDDPEFLNPVYLHQDLLVHPEYTQRFVDRVQELMFNDGILTSNQNIARMQERIGQVDPAIIAEAARWGDSKRSTPYNKTDWDNEVNWLLGTYFPTRGDTVLAQLTADGLYNQLGAPIFSQQGGDVSPGYPLQITSNGGTIYYSLDGATDPRSIGGSVNPSQQVQAYSEPIILSQDTTVWARTLEPSGEWSGLVKATFSVPVVAGDYDNNGIIEQADYTLWASTFGSTSDLRADGNGDSIINAADFTVWRDALAQQPMVVSPAAASSSIVSGVSVNLSVLGGMDAGESLIEYSWIANGPSDVVFSSNGTNASKNTTATFTQAGEYLFTVAIQNPVTETAATSNVMVTVEQTASGLSIEPNDSLIIAGGSEQLVLFETDQFNDNISIVSSAQWSVVSGGGSVDQSGLYTAPSTGTTTTIEAVTTSGSVTTAVQAISPTTWYEANSSFGATLTDSSGNGNDGNVIGSASWATGVDGNALFLLGGRANLPNGIVSGIDDITISTWFNLSSLDAWSRIFDFGNGTSASMYLTPSANGGPLRFAIKPSGQGEQQIDGPFLSTSQWYHVAVTIKDNVGSLYLNGNLVGTNTSMSFNPSDLGITTQNYLGDSQFSSDPPLIGRIDDFRIYSEALPADQILDLASSASQALASTAIAPLSNEQISGTLTLEVLDSVAHSYSIQQQSFGLTVGVQQDGSNTHQPDAVTEEEAKLLHDELLLLFTDLNEDDSPSNIQLSDSQEQSIEATDEAFDYSEELDIDTHIL